MCKELYLLFAASIFLLSSCSNTSESIETPIIVPSATTTFQPSATMTQTIIQSPTTQPTLTPGLKLTQAQTLTPPDSIQTYLLRLLPPNFLGAGYVNLELIMEDPDLIAVFEPIPSVGPLMDWQIMGKRVHRIISFSIMPEDPSQTAMGIIYILYGEFAEVSLPELVQESNLVDPILMDFQGFELMTEEHGDPFNSAYLILDPSTIVFGEESGVKAVLDNSLDLKSSPLYELSEMFPQVFYASVFNHCPLYKDLGCTEMVVPGLALGNSSIISYLHIYGFEDSDLATIAQGTIRENIESGITVQTGSMKIDSANISQEGRFIILENIISIDEISAVFE